jgi:hypothetical protein
LIYFFLNRCKNVQFQKEKGLVGEKAGSETVYKQVLEKRFASIHGQITPKWAQLQNKDKKKAQQEDSDNEEDEQDLTKVKQKLLQEVFDLYKYFYDILFLDCYKPFKEGFYFVAQRNY